MSQQINTILIFKGRKILNIVNIFTEDKHQHLAFYLIDKYYSRPVEWNKNITYHMLRHTKALEFFADFLNLTKL